MNPKTKAQLYSLAIAFLAGSIIGSLIHGFLSIHAKGGNMWFFYAAAVALIVSIYNWMKEIE